MTQVLEDFELERCTDYRVDRDFGSAGILDPLTLANPPLPEVERLQVLLDGEWVTVASESYERVAARLGPPADASADPTT